jgi:hypothetical protein
MDLSIYKYVLRVAPGEKIKELRERPRSVVATCNGAIGSIREMSHCHAFR